MKGIVPSQQRNETQKKRTRRSYLRTRTRGMSLLWPATQGGRARVVNPAARLARQAAALSSIDPVHPRLHRKAETRGDGWWKQIVERN